MLKVSSLKSPTFPILILLGFIAVALLNMRIYENEDLILAYNKGDYKNFEKVQGDDPLFLALTEVFCCEDYEPGEVYRVDISYFGFFLIETSEYLDVLVAPEVSGQCIAEVTFRRYP